MLIHGAGKHVFYHLEDGERGIAERRREMINQKGSCSRWWKTLVEGEVIGKR